MVVHQDRITVFKAEDQPPVAPWRSLGAAAQIAAMAVLVDARETFYAHFGFIALQQQPARLFLPMKTVADLFG